MKKDEKVFINIFIAIFLLCGLFIGSLFFIYKRDIQTLKILLMGIAILFLIILMTLIISVIIVYRITKNDTITKIESIYISKMLQWLYPLLISFSNLVHIDSDIIRRVFAKINNKLVMTKNIKVKHDEILVLLPHCLQNSKCPYKISNDINNCKMCGACNICDILKLCEKYKVKTVVATGGTLAREWIKLNKPKAIIAVACERDLSSGINDVRILPVFGIINERPNGPCFNTRVKTSELEKAIKLFLKEE